MSKTGENQWRNRNMEYLMGALQEIRTILKRAAASPEGTGETGEDNQGWPEPDTGTGTMENSPAAGNATSVEADGEKEIPTALTTLCSIFNLSHFERQIILFCVGMELDPEFPGMCAAINGSGNMNYPTFQLAFTFLEQPHLSVL